MTVENEKKEEILEGENLNNVVSELSSDDWKEEDTPLKNYYVFDPHAFVYKEKQADGKGLFVCEEWSSEDKACRTRKAFCVSDWIRDLGFVSSETVKNVLEKVTAKGEELKVDRDFWKERFEELELKFNDLVAKSKDKKEVKWENVKEVKVEEKEWATNKSNQKENTTKK